MDEKFNDNLGTILTGIAGIVGAVFAYLRGRSTDRQAEETTGVDVLRNVIEELRSELERVQKALEKEREISARQIRTIRALEQQVYEMQNKLRNINRGPNR